MNKNKYRIIFMGTPQFAAIILGGLLAEGYNIVGIITEPDKPAGRDQKLISPIVKKISIERGLKVFQPDTNKELKETIKLLRPDVGMVAAYGRILKKDILRIPKKGFINFHPSLLPQFRGPSPVQAALIAGLKETGVSLIKLDEGVDTGPIISKQSMEIFDGETANHLLKRTAEMAVDMLSDILPKYLEGDLLPVAQSKKGFSKTKIIKKQDGHVDFSKSAEEEERKIRAYDTWPGVFAFFDSKLPKTGGKRIKFIKIELVDDDIRTKPGKLFLNNKNQLCLALKGGYWIIRKLQLEGKKEMTAEEFLNGYKDILDSVLK